MTDQLLKHFEKSKIFTLLAFYILCLSTSCEKQHDCSGAPDREDSYNYEIGVLTDSSLSIFPKNLPLSVSFKNNFNQLNSLEKGDLQKGQHTWTYNSEVVQGGCSEHHKIYNKSVPHETVILVPLSQPNFHHSYSRTRYIEFQSYQNINSAIPLDSTFEILTVALISPYNQYAFIVPMGDVKGIISNYSYFDTLDISGTSFNNIYHIYADSVNYDANKIVPQGIYYNPNEGLVGYYLSNGELWIRQ